MRATFTHQQVGNYGYDNTIHDISNNYGSFSSTKKSSPKSKLHLFDKKRASFSAVKNRSKQQISNRSEAM